MGKSLIRERGSSCVIEVDVIPGAPRTALGKVNPWRGALQVKIAAQPREGEANEELVRFLAETLDLAKDSVKILRGETSRRKTIVINAPREKVERLLGGRQC